MAIAPLHPQFVHLPIALAFITPLLGIGVLIAWLRGALARKTWLIIVACQALLVISTFVAMQTGEQDEHTAEKAISHSEIHEHEEAGEALFWSAILTLLLSAGVVGVKREKIALSLGAITLITGLGGSFFAYRAGAMGGALVYEYGAARAFIPAQNGGLASEASEESREAHDHKDEDRDDHHDEGH